MCLRTGCKHKDTGLFHSFQRARGTHSTTCESSANRALPEHGLWHGTIDREMIVAAGLKLNAASSKLNNNGHESTAKQVYQQLEEQKPPLVTIRITL